MGSIAFLLLHIGIKLTLDHTTWIAAFIPFGLGFSSSGGLIGLGTLAGQLMIFVGITGALRNRFASPAPVAARWRAMHMLAYPAWCAGLIHGLYAGRAVKAPIFTYMYVLCVLGVIAALALRSAPRPFKRKVTDRVAMLLGTEERPGREELEASRARRAAETAAPGRESRRPAESAGRRSESSLPGYEGLTQQTGGMPSTRPHPPRSPRAADSPPPIALCHPTHSRPSTPARPRAWTCRWTCRPPPTPSRAWTAAAPPAAGRSRPRRRSAKRPLRLRPAPGHGVQHPDLWR